MKVGKPKSKRVPVRLRHKIEKASSAKQKKQRKEAKKNPQWRSRLKKDPGIPNLFPYKAKLLAEIEEGQRKKVEEAQKRREVAKAQRQGIAVVEEAVSSASAVEGEDEDEEVLFDREEGSDDEEMGEEDDSNPMAALLASAQARAHAFAPEAEVDDDDDDDENEDGGENDEWNGIEDSTTKTSASTQPTRTALPKQALADPIKAVSALLDRMQKTTDGIQRLIDHYQIPPLVTAGSDATSRFLVDVARKRGRLGRGGVPNLHSAALVVLADLNEERLVLPAAVVTTAAAPAAKAKGGVQIVARMAEPFRIEGLFEGGAGGKVVVDGEAMAVE